MIVYESTLADFNHHVIMNEMSDLLLDKLHQLGIGGGSGSEVRSWDNSLRFMKDVLEDEDFPKDLQVAVEYNIPASSRRVDFIVYGCDKEKHDNLVIVELKQWGKVQKINDISNHSVLSDLKGNKPTEHPSYRAYIYKKMLLNYSEYLNDSEDNLLPCAYCHNLKEEYRPQLEDKIYEQWIKEAPVFFKNDVQKLRNFIKKYIYAKSPNGDLLYKIDHGVIKPQKSLQDALASMMEGNHEFDLIGNQSTTDDAIMSAIVQSNKDNKKRTIIVKGGPGTGKSVLAVNVLVDSIKDYGLNAAYITKNSAPRNCYKQILSKGNSKYLSTIDLMFKSPFALAYMKNNALTVGVFDEAHRMQMKPYMYKGNDLMLDAIKASLVSVFFIDEDQRITVKDVYTMDDIISKAKLCGSEIVKCGDDDYFELQSQFRCNGSDGFLNFIKMILGIEDTANIDQNPEEFDFRVYDDPNKMRDDLRELNKKDNKARMVAGYCFDWDVKNHRGDYDIYLKNDFKACWNLENDSYWAINKESFEQVGCIHTCQGMEFNYVGVIIGKDLVYRDGKVVADKNAISKDDRTSGIKYCRDEKLAQYLIKNTYKVLLTRGLRGCFIYCEDEALSNYIKSHIKK
ncbi:MAG: DUF2075 domain-containing protein [Bacilli bacterium]|nr:DUF2075 domain-containing protein [Bacilli bacterium]MDD4066292.1 DUF2075 domain-containing protein [Bacilli bacterium]